MDWKQLISKKRIHSGKGRKKATSDRRSEFERDFDRISFSYPFRRLQDKTQTIPLPKYDFINNVKNHALWAWSEFKGFASKTTHCYNLS